LVRLTKALSAIKRDQDSTISAGLWQTRARLPSITIAKQARAGAKRVCGRGGDDSARELRDELAAWVAATPACVQSAAMEAKTRDSHSEQSAWVVSGGMGSAERQRVLPSCPPHTLGATKINAEGASHQEKFACMDAGAGEAGTHTMSEAQARGHRAAAPGGDDAVAEGIEKSGGVIAGASPPLQFTRPGNNAPLSLSISQPRSPPQFSTETLSREEASGAGLGGVGGVQGMGEAKSQQGSDKDADGQATSVRVAQAAYDADAHMLVSVVSALCTGVVGFDADGVTFLVRAPLLLMLLHICLPSLTDMRVWFCPLHRLAPSSRLSRRK